MARTRSQDTPISVRLPSDQAEALKKLAKRLDLPVGTLMKWAAQALLDKVGDGEMTIPFKF